MQRGQSTTWFPLLQKELIEQSNRRRTYIVRFLYAAALFGCGLLILYGHEQSSVDPIARLGEGRRIFQSLVLLQLAGILVLLPATSCSALTAEKERDTLTLLLLTPMPPWKIVLQKLLSRSIPMLCFVVLSFPLLAVAYGYGGVTSSQLLAAMVILVSSVIQVASIGVMCSAFCRTTVEAFLATYLMLGLSMFCCPVSAAGIMVVDAMDRDSLFAAVTSVMGTSFLAGISFVVACDCVVSRAFVPPRNFILQLFQQIDLVFQDMNSVTGGIVLVKDHGKFPESNPIAWRESTKKSLGTARYLFRVLVLLEVPVLVTAQTISLSSISQTSSLTVLSYLLWGISIALICIHAGGVVTSERSRQTLDSLLTVPISGRNLMLQKLAGVRRLLWVLLVPFVTIIVSHHYLRDFQQNLTYLLLSLGYVVVLLHLTSWLAFLVGLKIHSQVKAVLLTLMAVSVWAGLGPLIQLIFESMQWSIPRVLNWVIQLSPATIVTQLEDWYEFTRISQSTEVGPRTLLLVVILALYAVAWGGLRWYCLKHADRLLGRVEQAPTRQETELQTDADDESLSGAAAAAS
ncbi:ABC transporter permease [Planctomicrobium sp. SH664]|uniref:ABC transporter permease n=1 Tax=Planctomicrobium sp. SH664 TaxID=3448125 RepID=UPI003F5B37B3